MRSIQVGIRQLHRGTSRLIARVEEGAHLVVTRRGWPIAVVVPKSRAPAWALQDRRPEQPLSWEDDEEEWRVEGAVRIAPGAEEALDALRPQVRARLLGRLRRLQRLVAEGRFAVKEGRIWALVEMTGPGADILLLALGRHRDLERRLCYPGAAPDTQPM